MLLWKPCFLETPDSRWPGAVPLSSPRAPLFPLPPPTARPSTAPDSQRPWVPLLLEVPLGHTAHSEPQRGAPEPSPHSGGAACCHGKGRQREGLPILVQMGPAERGSPPGAWAPCGGRLRSSKPPTEWPQSGQVGATLAAPVDQKVSVASAQPAPRVSRQRPCAD